MPRPQDSESHAHKPHSEDRLAVLYFAPTNDTNPLAVPSLHVAGYDVFKATSCAEAEQTLAMHGAGAGGPIMAVVLDASHLHTQFEPLIEQLREAVDGPPLPTVVLLGPDQDRPPTTTEHVAWLRAPLSTPAIARLVAEGISRTTGLDPNPEIRVFEFNSIPHPLRAGSLG